MEDLKLYYSAEKVINFLNSEYGAELKNRNPKLLEIAKEIFDTYQNKYYENKISNDAEAQNIVENINELKKTIQLISVDEKEILKPLQEELEKYNKDFQDKMLFDAYNFYDLYLVNLTSPMTETEDLSVTKNKRFLSWFGNSVVKNADGSPKILYHGTGATQSEFDKFAFKSFPAVYFAENKSYSEWFAQQKRSRDNISQLFRVYLRIVNPIDLSDFKLEKVNYEDIKITIELKYSLKLPEIPSLKALSNRDNGLWVWQYLRFGIDWINYLKKTKVYDGIHFYENNPSDKINGKDNVTKAWMVFDGNQIKTADSRNTTFSLFTDIIKLRRGGAIK